MMQIDDLESLYVSELQEACSFEAQIAEALAPLADKATDPTLREFIHHDVPGAEGRCKTLAGLLELRSADPEGHTDGSMQAILAETRDWAEKIPAAEARDAALIASLQRMRHYKMAVYGTLVDWARRMDRDDDADALGEILEAEKEADSKLSEIARESVNPRPVA